MDGIDNDCDGLIDCDDPNCFDALAFDGTLACDGGGGDACTDAPKGDPCVVDGDCCSGICKNNGRCR